MATMDAKPKALTSTERSRKFRERLKRDRLRSEGARKKDRERKRKARKKQKEEMSEAEKEIARIKKSDEMRKYRQKKKEIDELRLLKKEGGKKSARKKKARQASKKRWEKIQQEKHRKERKKLMVKNWRMRLKLKDPGEGTSKGISSYWATYRASLQAKKTLPITPQKRAAVLEKLCQSSPRTATILESWSPHLVNLLIWELNSKAQGKKAKNPPSHIFIAEVNTWIKYKMYEIIYASGTKCGNRNL